MHARLVFPLGLCLAFLTVLDLPAGSSVEKPAFTVRVEAGKTNRRATPVSVDISGRERDGDSWIVRGNGGEQPAQVVADGQRRRLCWIVSDLRAGETRNYTITRGRKKWDSFSWKDSSGEHGKSTDLMIGERPVLRYMYTPFDRDKTELTKKPFHHVFVPDGSRLITKGPGGLYPHHRGIYFGYNRCRVGGKSYDTWHAARGEHQIHREVVRTITGPVLGGHVVKIHWNDREGKPFVEETRSLIAYRQPKGQLLVEFTSNLRPTEGPVSLGGDRQHAGVQFRAAQGVAQNQKATRYLRPAKWAELPADKEINTKEHRGLPWNALQFPLSDQKYTVAYLSDPRNPEAAEFSERLYGRFGEFFPWELTKDNPLTVHYRWWIRDSHEVTRQEIQARYEDLAEAPRVTVLD